MILCITRITHPRGPPRLHASMFECWLAGSTAWVGHARRMVTSCGCGDTSSSPNSCHVGSEGLLSGTPGVLGHVCAPQWCRC